MIFALADMGKTNDALKLFQLINPINHAPNAELARRYKVEPYVIVAGVYGVAPHRGRGGWTWYTGAAGWCYRAGLEAILGLKRLGTQLQVAPKVPDTWDAFSVDYNYNDISFRLQFARRKAGVVAEAKPKEIDLTKVKKGQV